MQGIGLRVEDFGFRVSGLVFSVEGFGFRVSGFGFRVSGLGFALPTQQLKNHHSPLPKGTFDLRQLPLTARISCQLP